MRFSARARALGAIALSLTMVLTGCSGDANPESTPTVERVAGPVTSGKGGLAPISEVLESLDKVMFSKELFDGLLACATDAGCFGDEGSTEISAQLQAISQQLELISADVKEGIAATRVDVATQGYAEAERSYNSAFGTRINAAIDSLAAMTNPATTPDDREAARADFEADARVLMPGAPKTTLMDFFGSIAGTGDELSQGGLLGSAWRLIQAQARQDQGDSGGTLPVYLPNDSINLMSNMGTQRLIEGAQLVAILESYSVLANPKLYAKESQQVRLAHDLNVIWMNGAPTSKSTDTLPIRPGAAAVTASLPRVVPNRSGVFTQGFGVDRNQGLLVRNFSQDVDIAGRGGGPIANADAGYHLTPGLDDWFSYTVRANQPRREMVVSRASVNWTYNPADGSLVSRGTKTDIPGLQNEAGDLAIVTAANPGAGSVVGFAKAGSAQATAWTMDAKTGRIALRDNPSLCMTVGGRADTYSAFSNNWVRGYDAVGWLYPDLRYQAWDTHGALPRISLATCAPGNPAQQWFLSGPTPANGLPWTDAQALIALSPAAPDDNLATYPAADWKPLTSESAQGIFDALDARKVAVPGFFERYGSVTTPGNTRAMPPILHPVVWQYSSGRRIYDAARSEWPPKANRDFAFTAVGFPIVDDAGSTQFFFHPTSGPALEPGYEVSANPWISTAAILGQQVDPCGFTFLTPRNTYTCSDKQHLLDALLKPVSTLAADSPAMLAPGDLVVSPEPTVDGTASPLPTVAPTTEPTAAPNPSTAPTTSASSAPSASTSALPDVATSPTAPA